MAFELQCPLPLSTYPTVTMGHGGGGRLTQLLIEQMLRPAFNNAALDALHDGAELEVQGVRLAFSTDSYVVSPLFFPGGDIGALAVHGTINDLAMCGAQPLALSAALILEEGLPMETLWRIVQSMRAAAAVAGVPVVTGDTKVVERGKGDGVFINTSGVGLIPAGIRIDPRRATPGDVILVSGPVANHGMAIMSVREGLTFETTLTSDTAAL
ncbi:MAG: hydrogenase expression/formation protein HypE, partial [Chloroflexales bacterium]